MPQMFYISTNKDAKESGASVVLEDTLSKVPIPRQMKRVWLAPIQVAQENLDATRKRMKLDHLSAEEKQKRRKMKNRISAQTARDKKKYMMDTLQDQINVLNAQNSKILQQNDQLLSQNQQLLEENKLLRSRLDVSSVAASSLEPAALSSAPQQRDQDAAMDGETTARLMLTIVALLNWMSCTSSHAKSLPMKKLLRRRMIKLLERHKKNPVLKEKLSQWKWKPPAQG